MASVGSVCTTSGVCRILFTVLCLFLSSEINCTEDASEKAILTYKRLFLQRRAQHFEALDSILRLGSYERQYQMISLLLDKLFPTLTDAKIQLMEAGFLPGDPFPTDENVKEAFSNVAEKTMFFGDMLLRLPDITSRILARHKEWDLLIKWSVGFCNESSIFEKRDVQVLNFMAQELGIVEKDENYVNPYRADQRMKKMVEDVVDKEVDKALKKQKKKKEKKEKKKSKRGSKTEL